VIKALCKRAKLSKQDLDGVIGKVRILEDQNGLDGAAFDLPYADAQVTLELG
jgi:hypothetical protein